MNTVNEEAWIWALPDVGEPVRDAARELAARRVAASQEVMAAQERHRHELASVNAAEARLMQQIRALWTAAEIRQAKRAQVSGGVA